MAWTSPRTWVAGTVLTAAQLNTDVRDNLGYLKATPTINTVTLDTAAPSTPVAATLYKDSMVSAWARVEAEDGSPAILDDYNVGSLTDNDVGDTTVTVATAQSSGNHVAVGIVHDEDLRHITVSASGTGSIRVHTFSGSSPSDRDFSVVLIGGWQ